MGLLSISTSDGEGIDVDKTPMELSMMCVEASMSDADIFNFPLLFPVIALLIYFQDFISSWKMCSFRNMIRYRILLDTKICKMKVIRRINSDMSSMYLKSPRYCYKYNDSYQGIADV